MLRPKFQSLADAEIKHARVRNINNDRCNNDSSVSAQGVTRRKRVWVLMVGCCAEASMATVLIGVMRLPGCPFGSAWSLSVRFVGWANWVDCRCFLFFWLCSSALPGVWSFLRVTPTHSGNSAHNHYVNSCMPCCRPHVASTVRPHLRETSLACKARGRRLCLCTGLGHGICTCGLFSKLKGVATLRAWRPPPHGQGLIS